MRRLAINMKYELTYNTPVFNDKPICPNLNCIDGVVMVEYIDEDGQPHYEKKKYDVCNGEGLIEE